MTARKPPSDETRAKISASVRRRFEADPTYWQRVQAGRERVKQTSGKLCAEGHPLDETNVYVRPSDGRRSCRVCKARQEVVSRARRKAELEAEVARLRAEVAALRGESA